MTNGGMRHTLFAVAILLILPATGSAQRVERSWAAGQSAAPPPATAEAREVPNLPALSRSQPLISRRDLGQFALFAGAALAALPIDGRLTHALQSPRYQDNSALNRSASIVRTIGDPGAWIFSAGAYAAGRLANRPGLADAGLHAGEAVLASGLLTAGIKTLAGRQRPNAANPAEPTDADEFQLLRGFHETNASFPSGHTTVAFAAATAFSAELARTHPAASRWVSPALYTTAAAVGVSRLYNNQHWASDAIMGAAVGHLVGRTLDAYHHRHRD